MQVVGYETRGKSDRAALVLASDGTVRREALDPGVELSYRLGERHCAGVLEDDVHTPCGEPEAPYCDRHTSRWACARCRGDCELPLPTCREEHAVYLAAFAPATFKVGVTRSWRLERRLYEQGADRGAHLRTVPDGRVARQIEADIAASGATGADVDGTGEDDNNVGADVGDLVAEVGDRVRVPEKIRGLHRSVDEDAWQALLGGFDLLETFSFAYGLDLEERPMPETVATGTVRGTKGRVLVLEGHGTYAVDIRDLVGYELAPGGTDRALQSSFGAFE